MCAAALPAAAQPKKKPVPTEPAADKAEKPEKKDAATPAKDAAKKPVKEQNFNFEGLGLNGRSRSPQLLYFLERANEELERASLEKRSFIPHLVRTVEEEAL
ncbi:MAG TPA: hypothetical protein VFQ53_01320 [Kofleriaceae bacterium]|nr:hypothetical protein [Kofleriaceae bacterium]